MGQVQRLGRHAGLHATLQFLHVLLQRVTCVLKPCILAAQHLEHGARFQDFGVSTAAKGMLV